MVIYVEIFLALVVLFIGVVIIFNARYIVRKRIDKTKENRVVNLAKIVGLIMCIISLILIYYIR